MTFLSGGMIYISVEENCMKIFSFSRSKKLWWYKVLNMCYIIYGFTLKLDTVLLFRTYLQS